MKNWKWDIKKRIGNFLLNFFLKLFNWFIHGSFLKCHKILNNYFSNINCKKMRHIVIIPHKVNASDIYICLKNLLFFICWWVFYNCYIALGNLNNICFRLYFFETSWLKICCFGISSFLDLFFILKSFISINTLLGDYEHPTVLLIVHFLFCRLLDISLD